MTRSVAFGIALMLAGPAAAAEAMGNGALSLAALVGLRSPAQTAVEKYLLSAYLAGRPKADYSRGKKVVVRANEATCRISNVDITAKSCDLKFGASSVSVLGGQAQALYATMIEVGVPPSGAGRLDHRERQGAGVHDRPGGGAPGKRRRRELRLHRQSMRLAYRVGAKLAHAIITDRKAWNGGPPK